MGRLPAGLNLCDLDESTWQRFPESTCRELAEEVIRATGRAVRMPMPIAERRLPPLPQGIRVTDLDLEARTFNCLAAAGIHQRPQDLRAMTIEAILALPGFWVKCLLDLLTSLEYACDHPEGRKALRNRGGGLAVPRVASRYPRKNHRLAPDTLRDILLEPIPTDLVQGTALQGHRLCDLDEAVWGLLRPGAIKNLADLVVSRVNASAYNRAIQQRPLPPLPRGTRLEDVALENRTYNCLRREGFGRRPEDLAGRTVGDFLSLKAFGAKCLVDLLTSLESLALRSRQFDADLRAEAAALAGMPAAMEVSFSDPRLGPLLRAVDHEANTVGELVHQILRHRQDLPDPPRLCEQLRRIRGRIEECCRLSLEEELIGIFSPGPNRRDRELVAGYYGWDGQGGHTLEELGRTYGLSRERVRQICVRAMKRNRRVRVFAPVLDRALAFLGQRLPVRAEQLTSEFQAAGCSRCHLSLEAVRRAAAFLSREPAFALVEIGGVRLAVRPDCAELPRTIAHIARRAALGYGATTLQHVGAELATRHPGKGDRALILQTLQSLEDFQWLDETRGWFQLGSLPQYGLFNVIEKILSVCEQVDVAAVRAAIRRCRRTARGAPPSSVLLEFCRHMPGVCVEGNTIVAETRRDWRKVLGGVEAAMIRVLKSHGPVLERGDFEERCLEEGVNRFSFNAIVMSSPVIVQHGRSLYGLLGTKIDRKTIRSLSARKAGTAAVRVLRDYGHTNDGRLYLAYRLSKAAISGGVITVPAAMKDRLSGRFAIRAPDGRPCGSLVAKNGCAWGLGPALRSEKARPDDHLLILFDPCTRLAVLHLGDAHVLESALGQTRNPR